MLIYTLADRWGESDPRKIANLPDEVLTYWQAYFDIRMNDPLPASDVPVFSPPLKSAGNNDGFMDCFRIIGNG